MDVIDARKKIDLIDQRIMALLTERMELALRIGRLKRPCMKRSASGR